MSAQSPERRRDLVDAVGRVCVLMGGRAGEREISLKSGRAIGAALLQAGVAAETVDWDGHLDSLAGLAEFDRVFIAVHGRGGEDGQLQAALDLAGMPYTGSGVLGCALAMDKQRAKLAWLGAGLPTPAFMTVGATSDPQTIATNLGLPVFVKPSREGSSLGVTRAASAAEIGTAIEQALSFDPSVIAEAAVSGDEYTVGILGDAALPVIRLDTPREFYDYEAKYVADDTRYLCPCGLDSDTEQAVQALALEAFRVLDGRGWGRVDLMRDDEGRFWLIEMNTVPGMTDHSLVPMAAQHAGLDMAALTLEILALSLPPAEGES